MLGLAPLHSLGSVVGKLVMVNVMKKLVTEVKEILWEGCARESTKKGFFSLVAREKARKLNRPSRLFNVFSC
jgi:hypothetical protein